MKTKFSRIRLGIATLLLFAATMMVAGCAGAKPQTADAAAGQQVAEAVPGQHGAQLWSENCTRCHNVRSPAMYSDAQWEVLTLHMRVRANLTPNEYHEILAFLKSAH